MAWLEHGRKLKPLCEFPLRELNREFGVSVSVLLELEDLRKLYRACHLAAADCLLLTGYSSKGWIGDDSSQFLWCAVPTGWLGFCVSGSHSMQNSDCTYMVVHHTFPLQLMCRTVCVVLLWSCVDLLKVELSFDDEHIQGRGYWVLMDLHILKFSLVSKSSHLGYWRWGTWRNLSRELIKSLAAKANLFYSYFREN